MGKYKLEFAFESVPTCGRCMVSGARELDSNGESYKVCYALGARPKCPQDGCRHDCPLKEDKELK